MPPEARDYAWHILHEAMVKDGYIDKIANRFEVYAEPLKTKNDSTPTDKSSEGPLQSLTLSQFPNWTKRLHRDMVRHHL